MAPALWVGALGAAVGAGTGFLLGRFSREDGAVSVPQPASPSSASPATSFGTFPTTAAPHPALRHGMPIAQNVRVFKQYVSSFDSRTRNPQWVLEHVSREGANGDGDRHDSAFKEDTTLPVHLRNRLEDFKHSRYDRGHLAPAADHKGSQEAMNDTFSLSNISPQVGKGFNRTYWARVEKFVRDLTKDWEDVYVVTGPLYLPTKTNSSWTLMHPMIGHPPSMVAVPTHFFKVVLAENPGNKGSRKHAIGAFVIPNADIEPKDLEAAAGMQFFTTFLTPARRNAVAEKEGNVLRQVGHSRGGALLLTEGSSRALASNAKHQTGVAIHSSATSGDIAHLCEQSHCELVNHEWTQRFRTQNNEGNNAKRHNTPSKRIEEAVPASKSAKASSVIIEDVTDESPSSSS